MRCHGKSREREGGEPDLLKVGGSCKKKRLAERIMGKCGEKFSAKVNLSKKHVLAECRNTGLTLSHCQPICDGLLSIFRACRAHRENYMDVEAGLKYLWDRSLNW